MKKLAIALIAIFALTGSAFAANQVFVNVTSEPITQNSPCDKAGGFSLQFDTNTVLTVGDVITIDTALGTTLCRSVDLEISNGGSGGLWNAATVMAQDNTGPIYYIDDPATAANLTDVGGGVYFRLRGLAGTQRLTLTVEGPVGNALVVGADAGDRLVLVFLDQKTNVTHFLTDGIWNDAVNANGTYGDVAGEDATLANNTLCINVQGYTGSTVNGSMDSALDKFTFIPSNPQIAHIVVPTGITCGACKGSTTGNILIGGQGSCLFDYETPVGYCAGFTGSEFIFQTAGFFDAGQFQVEMTITSPSAGVYFVNPNGAPGVGAQVFSFDGTAAQNPCTGAPVVVGAVAPWSAATSGGVAVTSFDTGSCAPAANTYAQVVTSSTFTIPGSSWQGMVFDLPNMVYDNTVVTNSTNVVVRIRLIKVPCGEVFSCTRTIGTFVTSCLAPVAPSTSLVLPYFTNPSTQWWAGLAIVNNADAPANVTLTVYEADGDVGTLTGNTLAARGNNGCMWISLTSALIPSLTPAAANTGQLGDSQFFVTVETTQAGSEAFVMMGDGSQGMGYVKP